jgi:hypothetical protein
MEEVHSLPSPEVRNLLVLFPKNPAKRNVKRNRKMGKDQS